MVGVNGCKVKLDNVFKHWCDDSSGEELSSRTGYEDGSLVSAVVSLHVTGVDRVKGHLTINCIQDTCHSGGGGGGGEIMVIVCFIMSRI